MSEDADRRHQPRARLQHRPVRSEYRRVRDNVDPALRSRSSRDWVTLNCTGKVGPVESAVAPTRWPHTPCQ